MPPAGCGPAVESDQGEHVVRGGARRRHQGHGGVLPGRTLTGRREQRDPGGAEMGDLA